MDIDYHAYIVADVFYETVERGRNRNPNSIWNVDYVAVDLLNSLEDPVQELRRGAGGIHGGEEADSSVILHKLNSLYSSFHDLVMAHLYGVSNLDVGSGCEDMHHAHLGINASLGILLDNSGEAANLGAEAVSRNLPDAVELTFGRDRKSGLDYIHSEFFELPGDLELFIRGERDSRSLFSVTKSCIKNADSLTYKRPNVVEDDSPQRFLVS